MLRGSWNEAALTIIAWAIVMRWRCGRALRQDVAQWTCDTNNWSG
jgi:hypothetical protein